MDGAKLARTTAFLNSAFVSCSTVDMVGPFDLIKFADSTPAVDVAR
jgi:hypothetical protein